MKICFVGHTFHARTRSSAFIQDVLGTLGEVTVLTSSPDGDASADDPIVERFLAERFDLWVFWQTEYVAARLIPLGLMNAVVAPMYDGAWARPDAFWKQFINQRFLTFSRTLHTKLQNLQQRSASFEYWPKPEAVPDRDETALRSAFFWERRPTEVPNLASVSQQCAALELKTLFIHAVPDNGREVGAQRLGAATHTMRSGLTVTTSTWFDDAADFRATMKTPLFHFAPRALEGIGMMMLEAMACGQIVLAVDRPTANEYIGHLASGLLYDTDRPLDLPGLSASQREALSRAAHLRVTRGYERWMADQERLLSFLLDDGRRWPNTDCSAHFGLTIQRKARARRVASTRK
ncbi:MAG: glycosyltransferase [Pseudomonadota bacterium]